MEDNGRNTRFRSDETDEHEVTPRSAGGEDDDAGGGDDDMGHYVFPRVKEVRRLGAP